MRECSVYLEYLSAPRVFPESVFLHIHGSLQKKKKNKEIKMRQDYIALSTAPNPFTGFRHSEPSTRRYNPDAFLFLFFFFFFCRDP